MSCEFLLYKRRQAVPGVEAQPVCVYNGLVSGIDDEADGRGVLSGGDEVDTGGEGKFGA